MAVAPNILGNTTATFGGTTIQRIYSIDGPPIQTEQVDTTTTSSVVPAADADGEYIKGTAGDVVREYTQGVHNVGQISIETDFDVRNQMTLGSTGVLEISFNGATDGNEVWRFTSANLAEITVTPGTVPDSMRQTLIFQPNNLPQKVNPTGP